MEHIRKTKNNYTSQRPVSCFMQRWNSAPFRKSTPIMQKYNPPSTASTHLPLLLIIIYLNVEFTFHFFALYLPLPEDSLHDICFHFFRSGSTLFRKTLCIIPYKVQFPPQSHQPTSVEGHIKQPWKESWKQKWKHYAHLTKWYSRKVEGVEGVEGNMKNR